MASSARLQVFLSYSSRDRPDALEVKQIAEADGHDVWMDLFDIRPAERLHGELERGIKNADVLCLLVSPTAVSSPYVEEELRHAIAAERHGLRILPVILRNAVLPEAPRDRVALDARRGLKDPAIVGRLRRALGGSLDDALLLDDVRRGELADRAAVEAAEAALPARRAALERVVGTPIRSLRVVVDPDFWPDDSGSLIEIVLSIDIFVGSLKILLAPYVEGHTWPSSSALPERPPSTFGLGTRTRVDACLRWAGRTVPGSLGLDATDLSERPVELTFDLPGDEFTGEERVRTGALLERFELPSLRELVDRDASIGRAEAQVVGQVSGVGEAAADQQPPLESPAGLADDRQGGQGPVIQPRAFGPLSAAALAMLLRLYVAALLTGVRGQTAADLAAIAARDLRGVGHRLGTGRRARRARVKPTDLRPIRRPGGGRAGRPG
jgi:hypothetical protein